MSNNIKKIKYSNQEQDNLFCLGSGGILCLENDGEKSFFYIFDCLHENEILKLRPYLIDAREVFYIGELSIANHLKKCLSDELDNLNYIYKSTSKFSKNEIRINNVAHPFSFSEKEFSKITLINEKAPELKKKRKVLIIDDSKVIQKILKSLIDRSDLLEICAIASDPNEAIELLKTNAPDLITLDIHMPIMNGVELFKSHLKALNIPTVIISSIRIEEGPLVMEALSLGAIDYIQKPSLNDLKEHGDEFIYKLENSSQIKINHKSDQGLLKGREKFLHTNDGIILIGSSTGGTVALESLFTNLPDQIPPIVVVQHIPAVFSKALADRLNSLCPFLIKEISDGEVLKENTIYIAPGGTQIKLVKKSHDLLFEVNDDAPVNRFKPSVDYFFNSVTKINKINKHIIGIILTGMGKDGAKELLNLKNMGAYTFAQDEASCVVFGMPKVAIELGAAIEICSLTKMPKKIIEVYNQNSKKKAA